MNTTFIEEEAQPDEYVYILPIIVTLGLSGNIISLVTIFHSRLRHISANVYLIVLTSADSVFLFGVLLICFKVDFIAYEFCVGLEYVLMTASYVSSWSTAALTIERYLAIAHPLKHVMYGHVNRTRMIAYWVPIPFVLQLFQFVSLKPVDGDDRKCALKEANYQILAQALDTILCYLLPCLTIVILNILVALKIKRSAFIDTDTDKENISRRQGGQAAQSGSLTRILWVMPLVFVVLNTPFYVIMMIEVFSQVVYHSPPEFAHRSQVFVIIYNTAHYLYYINTAIDVVVYAFSSANFRKTAVIAWKRILCPGYEQHHKHKVLVTGQSRGCRMSITQRSGRDCERSDTSFARDDGLKPLVDTKVHYDATTM
ncbi:7 transmembrane receptor [Trichostrongylus colubriformis]|uniref:7 transmembrane receptor n=1 Tax=Trichostrongylus colubriformis TaxID=6319 RepID=A0AAN8FIG3_TRICO